MKIGIVGATGVLGRALLPLLSEQGHIVRALVRSPEKIVMSGSVEPIHYDLLAPDDTGRLRTLLDGCEAVLHMATAIPSNFAAPGAWDADTRLRTDGTRRLLDAALTVGAKLYIQQSIVMAYQDGGDTWLDETAPLDPARQTIITMESMVRAIAPEKMAWCILRGGLFVGPDTFQDRAIARLRAGQDRVACDGSNFISPIHVADMATAIAAAVQHRPAGTIFNIVDEPIREGEYRDRLAALVGAPTPVRDPNIPCPASYRCRNQAARTALHWTPTHSIWPTLSQVNA